MCSLNILLLKGVSGGLLQCLVSERRTPRVVSQLRSQPLSNLERGQEGMKTVCFLLL